MNYRLHGGVKWASHPPLESLREILEGREKGGIREGRGKGRRKGKREARKKGKIERKRREIVKGEEENWKWKGEGTKICRGLSFFFFFFFLIHWNLFGVYMYKNGYLLWGKFSNLSKLGLYICFRPWGCMYKVRVVAHLICPKIIKACICWT